MSTLLCELHIVTSFQRKRGKVTLQWKNLTHTKSARYYLNQIPYKYAVEVINSFKGLNLINSVLKKLWTEVCNIAQEAADLSQRTRKARRQSGYLRGLYKYLKR